MPRTVILKCDRCRQDFRAPRHLKKARRRRFEGKVFRQKPTVYCSLTCGLD
jgi:hypothetical protein